MPHQCTTCGRTFPDGSKEMLSGCPDCGGNKFQFTPDSSLTDPDRTESESAHPTATGGQSDDEFGSEWEPATVEPVPEDQADGRSATGDSTARADDHTPTTDSRNQPDDSSRDTESPAAAGDWPETAKPPAHRSRSEPDRESSTSQSDDTASSATTSSEDAAQKTARTDVVSSDDLPSPGANAAGEGATDRSPATAEDGDSPDHGRVVSEPSGENPSIDDLRAELNEQFESIKILNPGQYELNLMELYNREEYIISLQRDGRYVIEVPETWREGDE